MYDILAFIVASYTALWLRFDFIGLPITYLDIVYQYLLVDIGIMIIVFHCFRLYANVWSYASISELLDLISGCITFEIINFIYKLSLHIMLPRSFYVLHLVVLSL